MTPTPDEVLDDMLDNVWPTPQRIHEWHEVLGDALAASQEQVRELEAGLRRAIPYVRRPEPAVTVAELENLLRDRWAASEPPEAG